MEKLIQEQLESLGGQREELIKELRMIDYNSLNYSMKEMAFNNAINSIDMRVDALLNRIT